MMIIECEKCHSRFNLDESLLKEDGSKVRCCVCKNVFMAYPPKPEQAMEKVMPDQVLEGEEEFKAEPIEEGMEGISLDELPGLKEEEAFQTISPDEIPELEEVETIDMKEALERAEKIEQEITRKEVEEEVPEEKEIKKKRPSRSPLLTIVLVVILLLLGGAAAVYFLAPDLIPVSFLFLQSKQKPDVTDIGVRQLSFKAVNGSFVLTDEGKQRFVIKGEVKNNYPSHRSFILIMGSILDNKGKVLKRMSVYAGNTFTEKQIKAMSFEELRKGLRNRFGKGRMNFKIKPGGTVPFMIIFEDLPENMSEFAVEGVSSSPGQ